MKETNEVHAHTRLMLNINYPSLEECWSEGYAAAQVADAEENNPYSADSSEYEQWAEGWWAGYYGEEHLYSEEQAIVEETINTTPQAANESAWRKQGVKRWAVRVAKVAGTIAATVVAVELLDIAV